MAEPFIGEIKLFSFDFAPKGWAKCDGQKLLVSQYEPLHFLLGTNYGGDGITYFHLPDLRSRVPIACKLLGFNIGYDKVNLNINTMPTHKHKMQAINTLGDQPNGENNMFSQLKSAGEGKNAYTDDTKTTLGELWHNTIAETGKDMGHDNIQPSLAVNFCIALTGLYPPRS